MVWAEKVVLDSPDDSVAEDIRAIQASPRGTGHQVGIDLFGNVYSTSPVWLPWKAECGHRDAAISIA